MHQCMFMTDTAGIAHSIVLIIRPQNMAQICGNMSWVLWRKNPFFYWIRFVFSSVFVSSVSVCFVWQTCSSWWEVSVRAGFCSGRCTAFKSESCVGLSRVHNVCVRCVLCMRMCLSRDPLVRYQHTVVHIWPLEPAPDTRGGDSRLDPSPDPRFVSLRGSQSGSVHY